TAVVNTAFKDQFQKTDFKDQSNDKIIMTSHEAEKLVYDYTLTEDRVAVFSENYYPHGWKIDVDGEPVDMAQANYVLRAVALPKGKHTVTFEFDPDVVRIG